MQDEHKENQAKKLQQLFAEVNNQEFSNEEKKSQPISEFVEVDVLQLPPRSEVHQKSKLSIQINMRSPLFRFSVVIFLVLLILGVIYYFSS